jgi:hypothetical protein
MQKSLQSYQELTLLEQESSQSRQASFLKVLLSGLIILHLASHLTCYAFNGQLFYYFVLNLLGGTGASTTAPIYMANFMALSSLLAGILISPRAIIAFTALNSLLIGMTFLLLQPTYDLALRHSFLSVAFTCLIGIISWLYQSTLAKSDSQLEMARQELMRSQLEKARELEALVAERTQELSGTLTHLKKMQKELV